MKRIAGAGGGGKEGGGGGVQEAPDSLSSVALVSIVEIVGEGPMYGLVNGEHSIYIEGVPLRDLTGTPNYKPFIWDFRPGTQDQTVISGFEGTQQSIDVGLKFTVSGGRIIREIPDPTADSVRVTIGIPGLTFTSDKGEIGETSVSFKIGVRRDGLSNWQDSPVITIKGKTTAKYQQTYELDLTNLGAGPYQVSVLRITADSTSSLLVNDTYFDLYTVVNYEYYNYPNTCLAAIRLDSRYFSQIPSRKYHVKGLITRVPKNYDPITRVYATSGPGTTMGAWDGTYKLAYHNSPVWALLELLTNRRFGLGRRIDDTQINKWKLYQISQYCDQLVPTGLVNSVFDSVSSGGFDATGMPVPNVPVTPGNYEPRFTFNAVINTQQDAYKLISALTSVFRGMSYWSGSAVNVTQDRPTPVTFQLNNTNVKKGAFRYSGTSRAQRRTVAIVGWNDITEGGIQKFEYVQDLEGIKKIGVRTEELIGFGCTSRYQARRIGLWFLYTERYEAGAVECEVGADFAYVMPGDVGEIMDSHKSGVRWGGRVLSGTTTSLNLDAPVDLQALTYMVSVRMADGTIYTGSSVITTPGTLTTIPVTPAMPQAPKAGALWILAGATLSARKVRLVSKTQSGKDGFGLFLVDHNPTKYDAIDYGNAIKDYDYSFLDLDDVDVVLGLNAVEQSFKPFVGSPTKTNVLISWNAVTSPLHKGFYVRMTKAGSTFEQPLTSDSSVEFKDVSAGSYTITVRAINQFSKAGPDSTTPLVVTGVDSIKPAQVTNFRYEIDGFNGVRLLWDTLEDYIDAYVVKEGTTFDTGVLVAEAKGDRLAPIQMTNAQHRFWIKARDTSLNYSEEATQLLVDLASIGKPVLASEFKDGSAIISWNPVTSPLPIVAYDFRYGADWDTGTVYGSTSDSPLSIPITWLGDRKIHCKARDCARNFSEAGSITVNVSRPPAVTGVAYTFQDTDVIITWVPTDAALPVKEFEIREGNSYTGSVFVDRVSGTSLRYTVNWPAGVSNAKKFWITQVDSNGNVGVETSVSAVVVAPAAPAFSGIFSGQNYILDWEPGASSLRIDTYVLRFGSSFETGTPVASVKAETYSARVNWGGASTFWIAAKDSFGNIGTPASTVLTVVAPPAPAVSTLITPNFAAQVQWEDGQGTLPVVSFEVEWLAQNGDLVVVKTTSNVITTDINWTGNKTFTVRSVDSAGNKGAGGTAVLKVNVPGICVVSPGVVVGPDFFVKWTCTPGSLPLAGYEVRYGTGSFDAATPVAILDAQNINIKGAWVNGRTYLVRARDTAGNVGPAGSVILNIVAPLVPTVTQTVIDNNVILRWNDCKQTMPVATYEVRHATSGTPFESADVLGSLLGQFTTAMEVVKGYYDYFVTCTDSAGNVTVAGRTTAYVNQPPDYQVQLDRDSDFNGVNYEFSANGVLEGWTVSGATQVVNNGVNTLQSTGTDPLLVRSLGDMFFYGCEHPVIKVKIRRVAGSGWDGTVYYSTPGHIIGTGYKEVTSDTSPAIGETKIITFDMNTLTTGGSDWMASKIESVQFEFGNTAADVFEIDYIRFIPWQGSNVRLLEDNTLLLPVDNTETYSAHFTTRSWASPSDQVTAGFPLFIQPTPSGAYYEEIIDYGAVLPGTQILVTPTSNIYAGTFGTTMTLSVKTAWGDAWTDTVGVNSIYAVNFRYIKVRIDYTTSGGDDLMRISKLNIKLSLKMRSERGVTITGGPTHAQGNLVDYSTWVAGTTYPDGWVRNGAAAENAIVSVAGPNPAFPNELAWLAKNTDANSNADGGFTTPNFTIDPNKSYMFAAFFKTASNAGRTMLRAKPNDSYTLAGVSSSTPNFFDGDLPALNTWYLVVGFLHEATYGTTDTNISGIYDLTYTKVASGTEFKQQAGSTNQQINCLQMNNTTDTAIDIQWALRPVVIQCDVAQAPDMIKYLINAATKPGSYVSFASFNPIDVSSITVSAGGAKQMQPVYDFADVPYPKGMNVYCFDSTGAYANGATVSWVVDGTW